MKISYLDMKISSLYWLLHRKLLLMEQKKSVLLPFCQSDFDLILILKP